MCAALSVLCVTLIPCQGLSRTAARGIVPSSTRAWQAAVASDSEIASAAGVESLRAGGNAVDAACATALALGVVDPFASGLGGGGFAIVYQAKSGKKVALDFRETAPARLGAAAPEQRLVIPKQSGLSVGVPGEARGLSEMVRRFGTLPFSRCLDPALRLARGFPVSPWLGRQIAEELERNPATGPVLVGKLFGIGPKAAVKLKAGDRVARPALAKTLEKLKRRGASALYQGELGRALVDATAAAGGVLSLDDLERYAPVEREPIETELLGRKIISMPPPSAGGVLITEALGLLAGRVPAMKRAGDASPETLHFLVESLKHGFADRARFLGDPDFAELPTRHLLDPAYHRALAAKLMADHVLAHHAYGTPAAATPAPARDAGTAHISVVDRAGNAVALTSTINLAFGSRIVAGDTGILLNDEMDDFTASPEAQDVFSLAGGKANFAAPGKRPLSSMSPTIVLGDDGVELVTGAAGGPRIVSATLQMILRVLVFGQSAAQAVKAPRVHHQWEPDILLYEPGFAMQTIHALETKGHHVEPAHDLAKANLIVRSRSGLDAASDPRSGGAPAGY